MTERDDTQELAEALRELAGRAPAPPAPGAIRQRLQRRRTVRQSLAAVCVLAVAAGALGLWQWGGGGEGSNTPGTIMERDSDSAPDDDKGVLPNQDEKPPKEPEDEPPVVEPPVMVDVRPLRLGDPPSEQERILREFFTARNIERGEVVKTRREGAMWSLGSGKEMNTNRFAAEVEALLAGVDDASIRFRDGRISYSLMVSQ